MQFSALLRFIVFLPLALSTTSSKRGLVYVPSADHPSDDKVWISSGSDLTWYYNYASTPSSAFAGSKLLFVPMLWGAPASENDTSFYDDVKAQVDGGSTVKYVLGFNEPDGSTSTGGSNVDASRAATIWKEELEPLRKLGIQLGAPAVTGSSNGFVWLQAFFTACAGKCTPDFIPVHWYGDFQGLASHIGQIMGTYPNMSVWVTEYALPNASLVDTQSFYNTSSQYFDRIDNITHYSYFGAFRSDVSNVGPNAAMLTQDGKLTDIGGWYLGGAATNNIPKGAAGRLVSFAGWGLLVGFVCVWLLT